MCWLTEKYPEIRLSSTHVEEGKKTGEGLEVTVEGRVTLHGVEKPISLPVRLRRETASCVRGEPHCCKLTLA